MSSISATFGAAPSYFMPQRAPSATWDYRGGFLRDLLQKLAKAFGPVPSFQFSAPEQLLAQWSPLSGSERIEAFVECFDAVERFRVAPSNWSDSPATAPDESSCAAATSGLLGLLLQNVDPPTPMLLDDGVLGAYWSGDDWYASIDFEPDGVFPWTVVRGDNITSGVWSEGPVPEALLKAIARQ